MWDVSLSIDTVISASYNNLSLKGIETLKERDQTERRWVNENTQL
jgi:hypothetical protein